MQWQERTVCSSSWLSESAVTGSERSLPPIAPLSGAKSVYSTDSSSSCPKRPAFRTREEREDSGTVLPTTSVIVSHPVVPLAAAAATAVLLLSGAAAAVLLPFGAAAAVLLAAAAAPLAAASAAGAGCGGAATGASGTGWAAAGTGVRLQECVSCSGAVCVHRTRRHGCTGDADCRHGCVAKPAPATALGALFKIQLMDSFHTHECSVACEQSSDELVRWGEKHRRKMGTTGIGRAIMCTQLAHNLLNTIIDTMYRVARGLLQAGGQAKRRTTWADVRQAHR